MSLEEALSENTAALKAVTAALTSGKAATPAAARGPGRPPGRPKNVSLDDVKATAAKVVESKGRPAAVALIKEHGAASLAELNESKYAAFIAAAEVLLAEEDEPGEDEL